MVHLKDFVGGKCRYLALVDREDNFPKSGTCFAVRPSLLRPGSRAEPLINSQNFRKNMSKIVKLDNMDAYVLHNMMPDRDATIEALASGTFYCVMRNKKEVQNCEATRYGLKIFCLDMETFSNFVQFKMKFMLLFTLMTETRTSCVRFVKAGVRRQTRSIPWLWDLYKLSDLPISGQIYDDAVPDIHTLCAHTNKDVRRTPKAYESLLAAYRQIRSISYNAPMKRKKYNDAPPKSTYNPSGKLADQPLEWSTKELHLFNSLGIEVEGRRETTYVAAFLSCWLCVFVFLENEDRLIKPATFEVIVLMARSETFSLAIPVIEGIYRGLNVTSRFPNPSYSSVYFPAHYLYGWLAIYFNINHVMDPSPPDVEACCVIHEGSGARIGCTMLNKNKNIFLFDDGNLDHIQMSYLSSLHSGYVSLRHYDSFFIEPYLPYWFSRQFGFCQDIPSAITCKVQDSSNVSYDKHKLKTIKFHELWTKVTTKDLRHNITKLFSAIESSSSNLKRVSPHKEARDAHCEDKSTSDAESEINFKHQRGRRSKKPRTADLEGNETDFGNAFDNIPIPSNISIDLTKVGDIDFEMGTSFNNDDAMIEEAIEPLNVHTDKTGLVKRSNPASPAQTHHSINGPSMFEINAKTLGIPLDAKGIPRAPLYGDAIPTPLISTIHVTPASQGIFTSAIRILGNEYLTLLKQTPFDKVSDRHGEASQVYKVIRVMYGNPEPLKSKVDEYVWAIKGHHALNTSLSDRQSGYDKALIKHKELEEENAALKKKEDELLKELEDVRQRMDQVINYLGDNRNSLTTLETTVHATKRRMEELEVVPVCSAEEMELFEEQERKLLEFQSLLDSSEWIVYGCT
ncbi:E3 ubiquitin-protein ligase TRIM71 [Bienertia sinuspersici]